MIKICTREQRRQQLQKVFQIFIISHLGKRSPMLFKGVHFDQRKINYRPEGYTKTHRIYNYKWDGMKNETETRLKTRGCDKMNRKLNYT